MVEIKDGDDVYFLKDKSIIFLYTPKGYYTLWYGYEIQKIMQQKFYLSKEGELSSMIERLFEEHIKIPNIKPYAYIFTSNDTHDLNKRVNRR